MNDSYRTTPAFAVGGESTVYVVVCQNDKDDPRFGADPDGPLVMETYTRKASRDEALQRAAEFAGRYGTCRIARLVFEDERGVPL